MLNSDENQFEAYLKNFKPVAPTAMPRIKQLRYRSIRYLALWGIIAASVAILVIVILVWHTRPLSRDVNGRTLRPVSVNSMRPIPPLTIGSANRWIRAARSVDDALDNLAFGAKNAHIPANKESAIAVLSEENTTL